MDAADLARPAAGLGARAMTDPSSRSTSGGWHPGLGRPVGVALASFAPARAFSR